MARTTPQGLYVWDLSTDNFDHTQLAANWDLVDTLVSSPANAIESLAALPTTSNFAGRMVMLNAADGGFPAWTLVRFDGSAWRNAGAIEVLPILPTLNNYPGRIVVISGTGVSGFSQWDVARFDGSAWDVVGGLHKYSTGIAASNINGFQLSGDLFLNAATRGIVIADRTTGIKYRLYIDKGNLGIEVCS